MNRTIYVGNLSYTVTEQAIKQAFSQVGNVLEVRLITDRETGKNKGFAYVEMRDETEAANALRLLNGKFLDGRPMNLKEANPRAARPPR